VFTFQSASAPAGSYLNSAPALYKAARSLTFLLPLQRCATARAICHLPLQILSFESEKFSNSEREYPQNAINRQTNTSHASLDIFATSAYLSMADHISAILPPECPALPAELWGKVFTRLDDFTVWMRCRNVSKMWRAEAESEFARTPLSQLYFKR
jgi:hypothetical protein